MKERNRLIDNGSIDIGRAICPISTTITRAESERMLTVYGRQIDLNDIRERHLQLMSKKGILRKTPYMEMSIEDCKSHIQKYNGKFILILKHKI